MNLEEASLLIDNRESLSLAIQNIRLQAGNLVHASALVPSEGLKVSMLFLSNESLDYCLLIERDYYRQLKKAEEMVKNEQTRTTTTVESTKPVRQASKSTGLTQK